MGSFRSWVCASLSLVVFFTVKRFCYGFAFPALVSLLCASALAWEFVLRVPELRRPLEPEPDVKAQEVPSKAPAAEPQAQVPSTGAAPPRTQAAPAPSTAAADSTAKAPSTALSPPSDQGISAAPAPSTVQAPETAQPPPSDQATSAAPAPSTMQAPSTAQPPPSEQVTSAAPAPSTVQEPAVPEAQPAVAHASPTPAAAAPEAASRPDAATTEAPEEAAVEAQARLDQPEKAPLEGPPEVPRQAAPSSSTAEAEAPTEVVPEAPAEAAPEASLEAEASRTEAGAAATTEVPEASQEQAKQPVAAEDSASEQGQPEEENEFVDLPRAQALRLEGNELFKAGKMHDAREVYSEAIHLMPVAEKAETAVLYCNRAACMQKLGRWDDTIADCKRAIELRPDYVKAYMRRSGAFEAQDKWHDAFEDLKKAAELDPALKSREYKHLAVLEKRAQEQFEKDKGEMLGKLKDLGNTVLGKFGMSLDNFKMEQDPNSGSYSIKFQN